MSDEDEKKREEPEYEGKRQSQSKLLKLKCWPEVKKMLEDGISVSDISYHIQNVRCEYLEANRKSLERNLYYWIQRNGDKVLDYRLPVRYIGLLDSLTEKIDPLDAVNMLFAIQMDRIMMTFAKEKRKETAEAANSRDIRLADQLARTMGLLKTNDYKSKLAKLEAKDGDSRSLKETFESIESVKRQYEERFGAKAAALALNPESRAKVYSALSRIRKGDAAPVLQLLQRNADKAKEIADQETAKSDD